MLPVGQESHSHHSRGSFMFWLPWAWGQAGRACLALVHLHLTPAPTCTLWDTGKGVPAVLSLTLYSKDGHEETLDPSVVGNTT